MSRDTAWSVRSDVENAETEDEMTDAVDRAVEALADDLTAGVRALRDAGTENPYASAPPVETVLAMVLTAALSQLGEPSPRSSCDGPCCS